MKFLTAAVSTAATFLSVTLLHAAPFGTPSFTTAPADISIVNFFGPFGQVLLTGPAPSDSYVISVNTTIGSSFGAPNLVGETLEFIYGVENSAFAGGVYSLKIGGVETLFDPLSYQNNLLFGPPYDSETLLPGGGARYTYAAPFQDFGPREGAFPEFELGFALNDPLPTMTGYESCTAANVCEFSRTPLTDIGGDAIVDSVSYSFVEGTIRGGTITFFTPGGPPPEVIPLPATALMLLAGLGAMGLTRCKRATM